MLFSILIIYQVLRVGACLPFTNEVVDGVLSVVNKGINVNREWPWCDPVLGCLETSDVWYDRKIRPVNFVPYSRDRIGTKFFLHTRENRDVEIGFHVFANTSSSYEGFDPSKPTKFLIHGYSISTFKDFAQVLLDHGDYNVFRLNYLGDHLSIFGYETPLQLGGVIANYAQAASNARVVGLEIAYLVNWLTESYGLDPADVHLIGYSIGAQIAGYAGELIPGMGRITGLDPAGPYFSGMPTCVRLDHTDALFVDNYHTDGSTNFLFGFGTEQPMGTIDFYPNGGQLQPGCDPGNILMGIITPGNLREDIRDIATCSHNRAVELFMDSCNNPCSYLAFECPSYEAYVRGECGHCGEDNSKCCSVGMGASEYEFKGRTNVKMYIDTTKAPSFC